MIVVPVTAAPESSAWAVALTPPATSGAEIVTVTFPLVYPVPPIKLVIAVIGEPDRETVPVAVTPPGNVGAENATLALPNVYPDPALVTVTV